MFTDSNNTNSIPGSAVKQIKLSIQLLDTSVTRLARHPPSLYVDYPFQTALNWDIKESDLIMATASSAIMQIAQWQGADNGRGRGSHFPPHRNWMRLTFQTQAEFCNLMATPRRRPGLRVESEHFFRI